jgi:lysylphosphatidylglycerol synthetase-like protein (DUF2156 family)
MIGNFIRSIVEGLGSKTLAAVLAAVMAVFLLPLTNKYLAFVPQADIVSLCSLIIGIVLAFVFKQWHLDVTTGGQTSTQALMLNKLAKQLAAATKENTRLNDIAKAVDAAIPDEQV